MSSDANARYTDDALRAEIASAPKALREHTDWCDTSRCLAGPATGVMWHWKVCPVCRHPFYGAGRTLPEHEHAEER